MYRYNPDWYSGCALSTGDIFWRILLNSPANIWYPMTSDVEPFSKYSPLKVHLSPASRIPSEAPASVSNKSDKQVA